MKQLSKWAGWIAFGLALVGVAVAAMPPGKPNGFDVDAFGHLPVLEGGRVKPLDTVARNALLMIRSKQSVPAGDGGRSLSASEWLLDVMYRGEAADDYRAFVVDDPEVRGLMGIPQSSERYFSWKTLSPHLDEIQKQAMVAQQLEAKQRSRYQSAVLNLFERAYLYYKLRSTMQLPGSTGLAVELAAVGSPGAAERHQAMSELAQFRAFPPAPGTSGDAGWRSTGEMLRAAAGGRGVDPAAEPWARVGLAWANQDAATFNRSVGEVMRLGEGSRADATAKAGHELVFNRVQPFYVGMAIYVLALLALFASWLWLPVLLSRAAFGLLVAGSLVHTLGLVSRVILQGRPPVTNLYSSAVFVGWGAVVVGVILERLYRKGFGTAIAAACGFASLIVAHHLTGDGDTMEMMRAVLDSNFWLATHVVTITIGYSGTFLAGAIAIGWTLRQHLGRNLDAATGKALVGMTYGVICFALFFSFIGTVLGGIWADQSWGRFWGWDPKENGALLIVLWNAIILHARWGGYARERGIMAMAIFGNVITSLSWFGVNMLGVGLHSYGFMDKAFWALALFIGSQGLLMALTLLPRQFWKTGLQAPPKAAPEGGR